MPTRRMSAVDHHHVRVGLGHQSVGERHTRRACTDDQVIRLYGFHPFPLPATLGQ